jgi:hypothetical protein
MIAESGRKALYALFRLRAEHASLHDKELLERNSNI